MTRTLDRRNALVTGGARGIGAGIAAALVKAGANVVIGDVLDEVGRKTALSLNDHGVKADFIHLDVTSDESWAQATAGTIERLGSFDILVNNAGIEITSLVIDIQADDMRKMHDVNVVGAALGLKHAFRAMMPGGAAGQGGSIVNISSSAATMAAPGIAAYSATKSAVDRLTRVAAMEAGKLGYGVRVNCVYPGLTPTHMGLQLAEDYVRVGLATSRDEAIAQIIGQIPLGRLADIGDVADAVVFLCSDMARFTTGAGLPVDGGMGM